MELQGTVNPSSFLFPRCTSIYGWSHLFSNLIKKCCYCCPEYPEVLEYIRALVSLFRNKTWRQHIATQISPVYPPVGALLETFDARFAKWRYNTMDKVLKELGRLRFLCEEYLRTLSIIFPDFQDTKLLRKCEVAMRWKSLWRFIVKFREIATKGIEEVRSWSLGCWCHEIERLEGKT